jgi:Domain of unknown function (DUF4190)
MSSFCLGCGKSLAEGERFCSSCGRDSLAAACPPVDPAVAFGLPPETSGKAIFSLVSSFIFFFVPFSICAVIFGYLALWEIRRNPGKLKGRGLAIGGIVLGFLGVAFTVGLIGLGIYGTRQQQKAYGVHTGQKMKDRRVAVSSLGNENSAVGALRTLNTAEIAYSQAHHAAGYTCSLSDLSGAWGISKQLATGRKSGYVFHLQRCSALKPDGPIVKYQVVAYPEGPGNNGGPAYCSDQSDVIRVARNGSGNDCLSSGMGLTESELTHPKEWSNSASR